MEKLKVSITAFLIAAMSMSACSGADSVTSPGRGGTTGTGGVAGTTRTDGGNNAGSTGKDGSTGGSGTGGSAGASGLIIPSDRRITWQGNVGVKGGIPNRTTICATLYPNGSDDTTQVKSALGKCPVNQVVKLESGTFKVSSVIDWQGVKRGVVLRGNGPANTKILFSSGYIYMRRVFKQSSFSVDANLSVDAVKGSDTITLASVPSWIKVGHLYLIDQLDDPSFVNGTGTEGTWRNWREITGNGKRNLNQLAKVESITSTMVTFETPLAYGFQTAYQAQIAESGYDPTVTSPGYQWGIEDLKVEATYSNGDVHFIKLENCDNCWIKNIDSYNAPGGAHIQTNMSYRNEVRDSYFHYSHLYGAGQGYGVALYSMSSGNLIENNIFENLHVSMEVGASTGNVFAYNYELKGQSDANSVVALSHHSAHTYMNLFEGNYVTNKLMADFIHGSSSHNTVFRNRILGYLPGQTLNQNAVNIAKYNRKWNFVGNVLGTEGWHTIYERVAPQSCADSDRIIYELGHWTPWACSSAGGYDNLATLDILRHGNYDYVNHSTEWEAGIERTIPASLYLSSKPAFFKNLPWPAIGPDLSPMVGTIPAKQRFHAPGSP